MKYGLLLIIFLVFICSEYSSGQNKGLYIPRNIQKAIDKGTRTLDDKVGMNYWQNRADYNINIAFNPGTRLVEGKEKINYFNNSPDTLNEILVHLFPNFFKKGNPRDFAINSEDESNGVVIEN